MRLSKIIFIAVPMLSLIACHIEVPTPATTNEPGSLSEISYRSPLPAIIGNALGESRLPSHVQWRVDSTDFPKEWLLESGLPLTAEWRIDSTDFLNEQQAGTVGM